MQETQESPASNFLDSTRKLFRYYKELGDKTLAQLDDHHIHQQPSSESNSISIIVKHLSGNMLSRWTNFLAEDGEKSWRNREEEFIDSIQDKKELMEVWEKGWSRLFEAIDPLVEADMTRLVYIRNEGHTIIEAMNRQLGHYAYHVGQMVFVGRWLVGASWQSLSIPKGKSQAFNRDKFEQEKKRKNFI
ncbi:MAG: DUF1572 family protein [Bacteroidota bacterium]